MTAQFSRLLIVVTGVEFAAVRFWLPGQFGKASSCFPGGITVAGHPDRWLSCLRGG